MATSSEKLAKAAIDSATRPKAYQPPSTAAAAAIIRRLKDTVVLLLTAAAGLSAKSDEEAGGRSGDGGSMRYFNLVKYDYAEVVERRCIFVICECGYNSKPKYSSVQYLSNTKKIFFWF